MSCQLRFVKVLEGGHGRVGFCILQVDTVADARSLVEKKMLGTRHKSPASIGTFGIKRGRNGVAWHGVASYTRHTVAALYGRHRGRERALAFRTLALRI